jgi:ATP-dependent Clp protease ATP-binding subunit ClpX
MRYDDLFQYGMAPQFISRFESVVVLNDLGEAELSRIFVEPENSIFRTSREYFNRFGIDLQITREAMRLIAWEAAKQKRLGARALKEVWRRVIRQLEFNPLGSTQAASAADRRMLTIDEEMVRQSTQSRDQQGIAKAR